MTWRPDHSVDGEGNRTNKDRANDAEKAMRAAKYGAGEDKKHWGLTGTSDLLTDLMHLADREGFGFEEALRRAYRNHEEEK